MQITRNIDEEWLSHLRYHLQVIEKFGRFPHRNEIHKRATTPLEATFLEDPAFRFDLPLVYGEDGSAKFVQTDDFELRKKLADDLLEDTEDTE